VVLSKRERYVAIGTISVVALMGIYYVLISPLLERKAKLDADIADRKLQLARAQRLMDDSKRMGPVLAQRVAGPLKKNASEAESQMLKNIGDWARDARMSAPSIDKPDRTEKEKDFTKMTFRASGAGSMNQVGNFLWRLHTSTIPVRVTDLTIATHKEGSDDLTIQLGISTIFLASDMDKAAKPPAAAAATPKETTTP
jgi:hypothetical protein